VVVRLARENPRSGYLRIVGELAGVGQRVSATTVAKILRQAGVSPPGARAELSWREFLRTHAAWMIACDLFTVETLWLGRLYVLFFIELGTRRVHLVRCTPNPDGAWMVQQARQLAWSRPSQVRLRDCIHSTASSSGSACSRLGRHCASRLRTISPARSSTFGWREIAGGLTGNRSASSFTVASPRGDAEVVAGPRLTR
jgi:hypothetical protein